MAQGIYFVKLHGAGNDFVLVDARTQTIEPLSPQFIQTLSDRRFGIGFDQLLLLEPSNKVDYYCHFTVYNPDGGVFSQCGNGLRCMAHYLWHTDKPQTNEITVESSGKKRTLRRLDDGRFSVNIGTPSFDPADLPFSVSKPQPKYTLNVQNQAWTLTALALDNPHIVVEVEDFNTLDVQKTGYTLAYHPAFPEGTNVHFMRRIHSGLLETRTYERGAGETLACGTGACSAAIATHEQYHDAPPFEVQQKGGTLTVHWEHYEHGLWLSGPTALVYEGKIP